MRAVLWMSVLVNLSGVAVFGASPGLVLGLVFVWWLAHDAGRRGLDPA